MDPQAPIPSCSRSSPHRYASSPSRNNRQSHSQSPSRYAAGRDISAPESFSEKGEPMTDIPLRTPRTPATSHPLHMQDEKTPIDDCIASSSPFPSRSQSPHIHSQLSLHYPRSPHGAPLILVPTRSSSTAPYPSTYTRPRSLRVYNIIKPWTPLIVYAMTSLAFVIAVSFWKSEVFNGLDELSHWLRTDEYFGYAVLFLLIFLTTFPPVPLYSTLIILSGYTYGPWTGAIISYFAALSGAICVFVLSRTFLRSSITRWLSRTSAIKRVVRAIEKRPKLLFLIRLAPYPYNVMNCLLAASPTLSFQTYTVCTALSLFKVIIHSSIGASIHSFAEYHLHDEAPSSGEGEEENSLSRISTIVGVALCVAILIYLSYVARKAVDDELDDDDILPSGDDEETVAFLSAVDSESNTPEGGRPMTESPFRAAMRLPTSNWNDDRSGNGGRVEETIGLY